MFSVGSFFLSEGFNLIGSGEMRGTNGLDYCSVVGFSVDLSDSYIGYYFLFRKGCVYFHFSFFSSLAEDNYIEIASCAFERVIGLCGSLRILLV